MPRRRRDRLWDAGNDQIAGKPKLASFRHRALRVRTGLWPSPHPRCRDRWFARLVIANLVARGRPSARARAGLIIRETAITIVPEASSSARHKRLPLLRLTAVKIAEREEDLGDLAPERIFVAAEAVERTGRQAGQIEEAIGELPVGSAGCSFCTASGIGATATPRASHRPFINGIDPKRTLMGLPAQ
jgi:hypothetical protein